MKTVVLCCEIGCTKPAEWVRATQFAGDHPFCDEHARKEPNFDKNKDGSFFWERVSQEAEPSPSA